jgi:hypothetical protein
MQTQIKVYRGSQSCASNAFKRDAAIMATRGLFPTSQSWAAGSYGLGSFLFALLLCFVLVGFLVFFYMLIVKPAGTLTVTYALDRNVQTDGTEKTCPRCAEQVKAAASVCRFCGFEFLPPSMLSHGANDTEQSPRPSPDAIAAGRALGRMVHKPQFAYVAAACVFGVVWLVVHLVSRSGSEETVGQSASTSAMGIVSPVTATVASTPLVDSETERQSRLAKNRADDRAAIAEIEGRFDRNKSNLAQGNYPPISAVKTGVNDLLKLSAVAVRSNLTGEKDDAKTVEAANALTGRLSVQLREMYALTMQEAFMKDGMDVHVKATGKAKDQLSLTYVLMSQPLVYKFQNEMHVNEAAKNFGFKKITFTNGFEGEMGSTWTSILWSRK